MSELNEEYPQQTSFIGAEGAVAIPEYELDEGISESNLSGRLEIIFNRCKRLGQTACALAELSPANELIRYGAFGGVMAGVSHSPEAGALAFGLSTLAVEGIGAAAAAPLLETKSSKRFIDFLNTKIAKFRKDDQLKLSPVTKTVTALVGGSVAAMGLAQLEDNNRTKEQNLRYGLKTSAWLVGACAVQGALMAEGINVGLEHPEVGGIVTLSLGGIAAASYGAKKLVNRMQKPKGKMS